MELNVRRAAAGDVEALSNLLEQVLEVHHAGRPDIFKGGCRKYTDEELLSLIENDDRPIFVGEDEHKKVIGYGFCIFRQHTQSNILTDIKTLYIDDLCVDKSVRGRGAGRVIFEHIKDFAKEHGCYNMTLNVWACNEAALKFYHKMGLKVQKQEMEALL